MKNIIIIISLVAIALLGQAQQISETSVTFLCDVTDQELFASIENDFKQNLNVFCSNIGISISSIDYGNRLTFRMGDIEECAQLSLQTRSISLTDRRVSRKEAERQRNPRPLLDMLNAELARYKHISEATMNSSPIIDVTLKALREMNTEANEIIVICTDGVEYSNYGNFYRNIPTTEQSVERLISQIDPILWAESKAKTESTDPVVIVVLKQNARVNNTAQLKQFYNLFFHHLGVNTIRFIDNLSNNPNL